MLTRPLIAEFTREAETTRDLLRRVPESHLSWKPHPKSMSLGALALHVAMVPSAALEFLKESPREVPNFATLEPTSMEQVMDVFEVGVKSVKTQLDQWTDEFLSSPWTMTQRGRPLFTLPRVEMVRSVALNHWYHHRGELVVYLRLLDIAIPPVYGPTADENPFAADPGRS